MKKLLIINILTLLSLTTIAQDSLNFTKLSTWTSPNATAYSDCWGYSSAGREYAILGSNWGTHIIDITDPINPIEVNSFEGLNNNVIWRDFKVTGNYAYGVADNFGNSLQIFDLSNLPTSVTKVYDNTSLSESAHNIYIENDRAYLPSNRRGGSVYALDVLDISNPSSPTLLKTMEAFDYFGNCNACLHDIYVKNDTAYCSAGTSGLFIYDLTDLDNPNLISTITGYTEAGYNHASWVNEDDNVMVMADETHGSGLKTFDLSDIENPIELDVFRTYPGAIPHNPFIRGTEAYISHYHDGMQVFDISDPSNVTQKAFYDTYPLNASNNHSGYEGDWGVYPYFESKNIIASDISTGLYVLGKINDVFTTDDDISLCFQDSTISIPYNIKGIFNAGNIFQLELSDSNGTFKNPTIISTLNSTTSGTFNTNLPSNIIRGKEYKVRVSSTNPSITEGEYQRIFLHQEQNQNIDKTICEGDVFIFNGTTYDTEGEYSGVISGGANCDTNFNLSLQVLSNNINISDTICNGETFTYGSLSFDSTGVYTGNINSANGCDTFYTINLLFDNLSTPTITNENGELSAPSGYSYQWYYNGQLIANATNESFTPPLEGNYSVAINNGNCSAISSNYNFILNKISRNLENNFKIYPNPSNGIFYISNENNIHFKLEIFNSIGRKVSSKTSTNSIKMQLEKGIYLVKIITTDGIVTEKLIID